MEEIYDKNQNDKVMRFHYDNMPMQDAAISNGCKDNNFQVKICDFFLLLLKTKSVGIRLNRINRVHAIYVL